MGILEELDLTKEQFYEKFKDGFYIQLPAIGGLYTQYLVWSDLATAVVTEDGETLLEAVAEGWLTKTFTSAIGAVDWEGIGTAVGTVASAVIQASISATSGIAKEIIPDVIKSIEHGYDYIREKFSGHESNVIAAFVVGFLVILSAIFVYHKVITVATTKEWRGIGSGYLSLDPND